MSGLIKYEAACRALAAAKTVDEASQIRNTAEAMRAFARQAKNRQLELDAAEIRIRAERRLGELIKAQKNTVGVATGGEHGGKRRRLDGSRAAPSNARARLADAGIDKKLSAKAQKLAAIPAPQFERRVGEWRADVEAHNDRVTTSLATPARPASVHHTSESEEHYTPPALLDAVIECLGAIDLDPCSNDGEPHVPARRHYRHRDDGLQQPWSGRVFVNPPYGRAVGAWIHKLREEWNRAALDAVIALLPARTDTAWFDELTDQTGDAVVCFLRGRLTFIGNRDPAPFPSMVVYFGPRHDLFAQVFDPLGTLWQRPPTPLEWFLNQGEPAPASMVR